MSRTTLIRQLALDATQPLGEFEATPLPELARTVESQDLFVWFEDTSDRYNEGRRGIAGLPESLLPYSYGMRVIERRYALGHPHLLTALRVRCPHRTAECIAAIYTAALAIGTVAWIGTGAQYEVAWNALYSTFEEELPPDAIV